MFQYGLSLEIISAGKHCNITHTALEALMCTEGIAERTTSCYMLLLESIPFGPELLSSRFLLWQCADKIHFSIQHSTEQLKV
jgi:hypothetical protein